uniref:Putative secreted protein n=1 Tax=Anopheles marajoara TaxID=58244 RepID=A0A2M4CBJ1_9DIPT
MILRARYVERAFFGVLVAQVVVQWQQIDVVHCKVVETIPDLQEACIDQRCSVESITIILVHHKYVKRNSLLVQKRGHVRCKL